MSTGVIFILGKGVSPILASGVKSTWPQGSSEPGFSSLVGELDTSRYTLTAMSQMCGFSSRASFFRHFKNLTGITPADYLKSLKKIG